MFIRRTACTGRPSEIIPLESCLNVAFTKSDVMNGEAFVLAYCLIVLDECASFNAPSECASFNAPF